MTTKLAAARIATASGIRVRLADGRDPAVLDALLAGNGWARCSIPPPLRCRIARVGWPMPCWPRAASPWMPAPSGPWSIRGLPCWRWGSGPVEGDFRRRDAVRLLAADGRELGRGLCSLSSDELRQVVGLSSEAVRSRLGAGGDAVGDAVVHRDHLVLTSVPPPA